MGGTGSCGCGEHWRTLENAQEEILHNMWGGSRSSLGGDSNYK